MKTNCLLFVCVVLVCNVCTAADDELTLNEKSLKGLTGVRVLVENINADGRKGGLTRRAIQTVVELRLRRNGIKVLGKNAYAKSPDRPLLYININSRDQGRGFMSFSIDVELSQMVTTRHGISCTAFTWSTGAVGTISETKAKRYILGGVGDFTDDFSNAYFKANPKN